MDGGNCAKAGPGRLPFIIVTIVIIAIVKVIVNIILILGSRWIAAQNRLWQGSEGGMVLASQQERNSSTVKLDFSKLNNYMGELPSKHVLRKKSNYAVQVLQFWQSLMSCETNEFSGGTLCHTITR